jgi:hypothetical protein
MQAIKCKRRCPTCPPKRNKQNVAAFKKINTEKDKISFTR